MDADQARADLAAWQAAQPADHAAERHLRALNRSYVTGARLGELVARAERAGRAAADLGPLVERYEQRPPELVPWDGIGGRVDDIRFDEAYHRAGREVLATGVVAAAGDPGRSFEQATLLYLLSHQGEMGHMCPVTCTVGLVRALRRRADAGVAERFLPALLDPDYDAADRGAQFLTEVQGGSDVGANAVRAVLAEGRWRISGEKWFCSVADAEQFLVTARPDGAPGGTAGLGCFVVPRRIDGRPNGFAIRRLKDKLGTRAMASAEIDFAGAEAFPIGPLDEGFKTAVTCMLNASRWLNAVGNCGIARRAYVVASTYAGHRRAFGRVIGGFPAVRATLAQMKLGWLAGLHSTWLLTELDELVDTGAATEDDAALHRFLVNANKYAVSTRCTGVVRDGIEVLGGNGAIETFSVLPRLLRDSIVYEQWEGTHNVLVAQVARDLGRLGLAGVVFERVGRMVKGVAHPELSDAATIAAAALEELESRVQRSLADPGHGALHFRHHLGRLMQVVQAACLMTAADGEEDRTLAAELRGVADLFAHVELDPGYRADDDTRHLDRIDAALAGDAG